MVRTQTLNILRAGVFLLAMSAPLPGDQRDLQHTADAVVTITGNFDGTLTAGAGLIFADDGDRIFVLTANHVVRRGGANARNMSVRLRSNPDTDIQAVTVMQSDPTLDIAVLQVDGLVRRGVQPCRIPADLLLFDDTVVTSSAPRIVGNPVFPIGNPAGNSWFIPRLSDVIRSVSDSEIEFESRTIQAGHSGGVLLDKDGLVLGIIQADSPPNGRAIPIWKALAQVRKWGLRVDLYAGGDDGVTPLHHAAATGDMAAIARLLSRGCTPLNAKTYQWNFTPLHMAVARSHIDAARALLDAGADPNTKSPSTSLEYALGGLYGISHPKKEDALAMVSLLIERKAVITLPFVLRAMQDPAGEELTVLLLKSGQLPEDDWYGHKMLDTMLEEAAKLGSLPQMKLLLEAGANVQPGALATASETPGGQHDALVFLLQRMPIDTSKLSAIWAAVGRHHWVDVAQIMTAGHTNNLFADKDYLGLVAESIRDLHDSAGIRMLEVLLGPVSDVQSLTLRLLSGDDWTILDYLFRYSRQEFGEAPTADKLALIELLLGRGDRIPLGLLCYGTDRSWPDASAVLSFLRARASKSEKACQFLPLHAAVKTGHASELIRALARGTALSQKDLDGKTALHLAVRRPELVKILLDAKANPNAQDAAGNTPLHDAVTLCCVDHPRDQLIAGVKESMALLIKAGANVNAPNIAGHRPLSSVRGNYFPAIVEFLKTQGAR